MSEVPLYRGASVWRGAKGSVGRKVDVRLSGKGNSNYHGARLVHLVITMIKWIRTSRLSIKNSLSLGVHLVDRNLGQQSGKS